MLDNVGPSGGDPGSGVLGVVRIRRISWRSGFGMSLGRLARLLGRLATYAPFHFHL